MACILVFSKTLRICLMVPQKDQTSDDNYKKGPVVSSRGLRGDFHIEIYGKVFIEIH